MVYSYNTKATSLSKQELAPPRPPTRPRVSKTMSATLTPTRPLPPLSNDKLNEEEEEDQSNCNNNDNNENVKLKTKVLEDKSKRHHNVIMHPDNYDDIIDDDNAVEHQFKNDDGKTFFQLAMQWSKEQGIEIEDVLMENIAKENKLKVENQRIRHRQKQRIQKEQEEIRMLREQQQQQLQQTPQKKKIPPPTAKRTNKPPLEVNDNDDSLAPNRPSTKPPRPAAYRGTLRKQNTDGGDGSYDQDKMMMQRNNAEKAMSNKYKSIRIGKSDVNENLPEERTVIEL
eukprot:Pgem_evm1s6120